MFTQKNFPLTDEQYDKIEKWANNHECSCRCGSRASRSCCGGEISVTFTPTSIGTVISAQCICGKEINIEDL